MRRSKMRQLYSGPIFETPVEHLFVILSQVCVNYTYIIYLVSSKIYITLCILFSIKLIEERYYIVYQAM